MHIAPSGAMAKVPYKYIEALVTPMISSESVIPPRFVTNPAKAAPKDVAISCTVVTDEEVRSSSPNGDSEKTLVSKCGHPIPIPAPIASRKMQFRKRYTFVECVFVSEIQHRPTKPINIKNAPDIIIFFIALPL